VFANTLHNGKLFLAGTAEILIRWHVMTSASESFGSVSGSHFSKISHLVNFNVFASVTSVCGPIENIEQ
jgi:hypothetical protein